MKKAALHNLGCKVNAYETEAMQEMLEQAGYEIVPFREGADIYIINTCTVTNIADRKSRQMLHRARKMNPNAIVVAAGCYVQAQENEEHPADSCVDIVIGNNRKKDLVRILREYEEMSNRAENAHNREEMPNRAENAHNREEMPNRAENAHNREEMSNRAENVYNLELTGGRPVKKEVIDIHHTKEYEELHLTKTGEHTRAYIKVQDGCNQFCSYCLIPLARGRVRSRRQADVVEEITALAQNGYKEVVLTGIHLSSYGIERDGDETLLSLIQAVHEIEGIERIRLGSLEPRIITEDFVRAIAALPKMCPHFHLSLQSGCDETLKRMNRRYTSAEYYEKCELLRKYFGTPALTTDVIVGFPGETEEEFAASKAFVDKVDFYETHIFKYSKREGTKAAAMEHQVPEQIKTVRSNEMLEMGERKRRKFEEQFIGQETEVLIEETVIIDGRQMQSGHTREYIRIALDTEENMTNRLVKVRFTQETKIIH